MQRYFERKIAVVLSAAQWSPEETGCRWWWITITRAVGFAGCSVIGAIGRSVSFATILKSLRVLLITLLAVLFSSACSTGLRVYDSTARVIRLREAPVPAPCWRGDQVNECVVLLTQDWEALVIDYKAKCLQLGGSASACQTTGPP
jgi:hypothetical protein